MAKNNSNKKNQSVKNQSANALKYATYTSEKSGKTIPVVYGFADKEDERRLGRTDNRAPSMDDIHNFPSARVANVFPALCGVLPSVGMMLPSWPPRLSTI